MFANHLAYCRFWLRPIKLADGSINMMKWEAGIPGKANVSF